MNQGEPKAGNDPGNARALRDRAELIAVREHALRRLHERPWYPPHPEVAAIRRREWLFVLDAVDAILREPGGAPAAAM